ncbi:hypothetical protein [Vibrio harveyi]|uniref:hypothetical protein n=1 Tax=Vibrio harveyi TaxID=669 RepID=UPI000A6AE8CD|nr:hypothetical protein [Vibrio harveyi]
MKTLLCEEEIRNHEADSVNGSLKSLEVLKMKIGKVCRNDYPVTKRVTITAPIEVEVRGDNQVLTLIVNGKELQAFKGMSIHLLSAQEEYEKAAF